MKLWIKKSIIWTPLLIADILIVLYKIIIILKMERPNFIFIFEKN